MTSAAAQKTLTELLKRGDSLCEIATKAKRNGKGLTGQNFYARKFHEEILAISTQQASLLRMFEHAGLHDDILTEFKGLLGTLTRDNVAVATRTDCLRKLRLFAQSTFIPALAGLDASPIPHTEHVLPMAVVDGTRQYLESCIRQANGCYEHQWFDAAAVMIRKFVEILIIDTFEAHGFESEIKDPHGNYFMLRDLIETLLASKHWTIGRETRQKLPELKHVGDRSAHNRRYFARKHDIDNIKTALRLAADELLVLSKLR